MNEALAMTLSTPLRRAIMLGLGTAMLGASSLAAPVPSAQAQDGSSELVMPFSDVPEDHWAYQALLNLAGVHGCVSGYPDGTFQGDNTVSRYEFAAGMDACMAVLTQMVVQQQQENVQEVNAIIDAMEESLEELRQL